ncbi:50S ribosome-binding protein YggL, partial [Arthrospira platensis SPKY1]|nr:50S ribosome-binding protein YggL [Arthrospira platensis SPKY1]
RKKLRAGEFREFLFAVQMRFGVPLDEDAYEGFLDALLRFADSQRLTLGGLGGRMPLTETSAVVSARTRGSPSEADRKALLEWLGRRCEVESAEASAFVD